MTHYAYTNINEIIKKASGHQKAICLPTLNSRLNYARPVKTAEINYGVCSTPQAAANNSRATLLSQCNLLTPGQWRSHYQV